MSSKDDLLNRFINHLHFPARDSVYVRWYPKKLAVPDQEHAAWLSSSKPSGVYVHVPFCDRLCRFCPFNKRVSDDELIDRYVTALLTEIDLYGSMVQRSPLDFVYFGGGTPSTLPIGKLSSIIERLSARFGLSSPCEITVETHPTHLIRDYLISARSAGVTRFSSGFQAFDDQTLNALGAQHTVADIVRGLQAAEQVGQSIAVDLLFRCEGQTLEDWGRQLKSLESFRQINHVSCYSLVLKSADGQPPPKLEAAMTVEMLEAMSSLGLDHYASCASGGFDFSSEKDRCVYEVRHWGAPQAEYMGLGPGAFGYLSHRTTVNGLGIPEYIAALNRGYLPIASATHASLEERMRRYFVLGVKTLSVPLRPFETEFGVTAESKFGSEFSRLSDDGLAKLSNHRLEASDLGRLFTDTVSSVFFSQTEAAVPHPEEPEIRQVELQGRRKVR